MKALVCGGRDYEDRARVEKVLDAAVERLGLTSIVHGAARGADGLAGWWGVSRLGTSKVAGVRAEWRRYGNAAGPIRNQKMLDEHRPDFVIAFPGGHGTKDMCERAEGAGLKVYRIKA